MDTITNVRVKLTGRDGNAFMILGQVSKAMRKARIEESVINAMFKEATSGDYNHLLQTVMLYVEVR